VGSKTKTPEQWTQRRAAELLSGQTRGAGRGKARGAGGVGMWVGTAGPGPRVRLRDLTLSGMGAKRRSSSGTRTCQGK
jgi:hypothetical protein